MGGRKVNLTSLESQDEKHKLFPTDLQKQRTTYAVLSPGCAAWAQHYSSKLHCWAFFIGWDSKYSSEWTLMFKEEIIAQAGYSHVRIFYLLPVWTFTDICLVRWNWTAIQVNHNRAQTATCYQFSISSLAIHLAAICTQFAKSSVIFHVFLLKWNMACQTELVLHLDLNKETLQFCFANPLEGTQ